MTTQADVKRFQALQKLGCVACRALGQWSVAEIHHLKSGNKRRGHADSIPLCPAHHRGVEHDEAIHGPSLALSPRQFRETFGSDDYLLAKVELMLKGEWDDIVLTREVE
jgi:hypothetical protein